MNALKNSKSRFSNLHKVYVIICMNFIFLLSIQIQAQAPWNYLKQGTEILPAALARGGVINSGDSSAYVFGEITSLDIMDGGAYVAKLHALTGDILWEMDYDKPGSMELGLHLSSVSDDRFVLSCMLMNNFKPWIVMLDDMGTQLWSSESWSDDIEDGMADMVMSFETTDGEIALNTFDAYSGAVNTYFADDETGTLNNIFTFDLHDIFPDALFVIPSSMTHKSGNTFLLAGYKLDAAIYSGFILEINVEDESVFVYDDALLPGYLPLTIYYDSAHGTLVSGINEDSGGFFTIYTNYLSEFNEAGELMNTYSVETDLDNSKAYGAKYIADKIVFYNYVSVDPSWGTHPEDYVNLVKFNPVSLSAENTTLHYAESQIYEGIIPGMDTGTFLLAGSLGDISGSADFFSVIYSDDAGEIPSCIFDCVWPGDADNNGVADMDDLLSLGLLYGETGELREDTSIDWYAHSANEWGETLITGADLKYADCNGDGIINDVDTTAIVLNFGAEHAIYSLKSSESDIVLRADENVAMSEEGVVSIPLLLENSGADIEAIYGIRFTVEIESFYLNPTTIDITFDDSFLGSVEEIISLDVKSGTDNFIAAGIVRKDQMNISGQGKIATLHFYFEPDVTEDLSIIISNVKGIDAANNEITINGASTFYSVTSGTIEQHSNGFLIYPNPTNDILIIDLPENVDESYCSVLDLTGNVVMTFSIAANQNRIFTDMSKLPAGQYLLKIQTGADIITDLFNRL